MIPRRPDMTFAIAWLQHDETPTAGGYQVERLLIRPDEVGTGHLGASREPDVPAASAPDTGIRWQDGNTEAEIRAVPDWHREAPVCARRNA
jgi:hypothetical protein